MLKDEIYKFEIIFRTYITRASIKIRVLIFEKIIMRKLNVKFIRFIFSFLLNEHYKKTIFF